MIIEKPLRALLIWFLLLSCQGIAAEKGELEAFKSVEAIPGGIRLTLADEGGRWNYQACAGESKLANHGDSIDVKFGQSAKFVEKHASISLAPVDGDPTSFHVEKRIDARSFGKGITIESFVLSVASGSIVFGNMTRREEK